MNKKINLIQSKIGNQKVSPILPDNIKNYLIDIDGTICDDIPNEEPKRMSSANIYPQALKTLTSIYREI